MSPDLRRAVPATLAPSDLEVEGRPGAYFPLRGPRGELLAVLLGCPGCGARMALWSPGAHAPFGTGRSYSGDLARPESVTSTPSVYHREPEGCGWHGWWRAGVLSP